MMYDSESSYQTWNAIYLCATGADGNAVNTLAIARTWRSRRSRWTKVVKEGRNCFTSLSTA